MAITYTAKILLKRGYGDPSTSLDVAELGVDLSTYNLYVGKGVGNQAAKILVGNDPSISDLFNYEVTQDNSINNLDTSINDIWIKINQLDVSADITKEYVDGSLNKLDTSISDLYNEIENIPQDSSISDLYTITNDLSTRITNVDLSINYMSTYIDGSLALKADLTYVDSSISQVWEYLDEAEIVNRTIYVETTGSDLTGDGLTVGTAFATIGKALSTVKKVINAGVTVTINIGVGTFDFTNSDVELLASISGGGTLTINGTLTSVESGFTVGAADANDPFTYAVSGGNTASWTANQFQFYFIKKGSTYHTVTHNTNSTISIAESTTGIEGDIYQTQTILRFPNNDVTLKNSVYCSLNYLQFNISENLYITSTFIKLQTWWFISCFFNSSVLKGISIFTSARFSYIHIFNDYLALYANLLGLSTGIYIKRSTNSYCLYLSDSFIGSLGNIVCENPNTSSSACGIYLTGKLVSPTNSNTFHFKFVNCAHAFIYGQNIEYYRQASRTVLILNNTSYLLRRSYYAVPENNFRFEFLTGKVYGTPTVRWFYDPMYEFVNLSSGRNIQITGVIYPEIEQNLSSTLLNNSTTDISIGHTSQNKSIKIDYTLSRSINGYRAGSFTILSDGSALYMSPDTSTTFISSGVSYVDASAIAFSSIRDASIIKLRAVVDSSGGNVQFSYNAFRSMKIPLNF